MLFIVGIAAARPPQDNPRLSSVEILRGFGSIPWLLFWVFAPLYRRFFEVQRAVSRSQYGCHYHDRAGPRQHIRVRRRSNPMEPAQGPPFASEAERAGSFSATRDDGLRRGHL